MVDSNSLPIVCPHCGNHGEPEGPWEVNGPTPFRLIEEVVRTWPVDVEKGAEGGVKLVADVSNEEVDWESGTNLRLECGQCFGEFPLPESAKVEFE